MPFLEAVSAFLHGPTTGACILGMALAPVLGWFVLFFILDNKQPEPRRMIIATFVAGVLCTIPLVLYSRYTVTNPSAGLYELAGLITSIGWVRLLLFYLAVAVIEEYVKHVAMVWAITSNHTEFTQVVDGVVYGIAAAMGFAFLENTLYLAEASKNVVLGVFLSRALGATLGHAVFSGVFGYFYARAIFAKDLVSKKRETLWDFHRALPVSMGFHILRTHILPRRGIMDKGHTRAQIIAEGFWVAVTLHFLYNIVVSGTVSLIPALGKFDMMYVAVLILFGGLVYLVRRFKIPENHTIQKVTVNLMTLPEYLIPTERARKIRAALRLNRGW